MISVATVTKTITSLVATASVGTVVENIIKKTTPDDISRLQKIGIKIGSFVIGAIVSDRVEKFTESKFDEIVDSIKKLMPQEEVNKIEEPSEDISKEEDE